MSIREDEAPSWRRGPAGLLAWLVLRLRWLIVPAWIVAPVLAVVYLPSFAETRGGGFLGVVPQDAPGLRVQREVLDEFRIPLLSRVAVVERDPDGLRPDQQAQVVLRAVQVTTGDLDGVEPIAGALPVLNTFQLFPGSRESGTTAVTYLFFRPEVGLAEQTAVAEEFALRYGIDAEFSGVTGAIPARQAQANAIADALPWVELATVVLVALVVGLTFRSVGAPLVVLAAAAVTYFTAVRGVAFASRELDLPVPGELEPLLVVLLVGVMTDYAVFLLFSARSRMRAGARPKQAAEGAAADVTPLIITAGLIVAGGALTLMLADLELFNRLGPGMAMAVGVAILVGVTFLPAAIGVFGRFLFWPGRTLKQPERRDGFRHWSLGIVVKRPVAVLVAAAGVAGLVFLAVPLRHADLAVNLISGLPGDAPVARAADHAAAGFAPGMVGPAELLVQDEGIVERTDELSRLQELLSADPRVAGVLGPAQQSDGPRGGGMLAPSQDAARYVVVLGADPYDEHAIDWAERTQERLPELLDEAGLSQARAGLTGDSALAATIVGVTTGDMVKVGLAALAVALLVLALYLRAFWISLVLLAVNALAVLAALGAATWIFQRWLHLPGLTFYVPVAVAVLLMSFGADYTSFLVGRIWAEDGRPFRDAVVRAGAGASRAISVAGLALAFSFALLALVPLAAFRMFALAMFLGVLLDTFVVRSYIVPALLALTGRARTRSAESDPSGETTAEPSTAPTS